MVAHVSPIVSLVLLLGACNHNGVTGAILLPGVKLLDAAHAAANIFGPKKVECKGAKEGEPIVFTTDKPYQHLPLPVCAENMHPLTMTLYTRTDPKNGKEISRDSIPDTFDANKPTMFLTHGWLMSYAVPFHAEQIPAALQAGDSNVITVSWPGGSIQPDYQQAASNTRAVGALIGIIIDILVEEKGADRSSCHCVGHSLGAHVCGHAGKYTNFGRITGLDPAGPSFEDYSPEARLNSTDAEFVEIYHTDGRGAKAIDQGTWKPIGDVDFYVNGGKLQPMCSGITDFDSLGRLFSVDPLTEIIILTGFINDLVGECSHLSALLYWNQAMRTDCFKSHQHCTDNNRFIESCTTSTDPVQSMGLSSIDYWRKGNAGIFYVPVDKEPPYCKKLI